MNRSVWLTILLIAIAAGLGAAVSLAVFNLLPGTHATTADPLAASFRIQADAKGMSQLVPPPGASVSTVQVAAGAIPLVRLAGVQSNAPSSGLPGIYLRLPDQFEKAASAHKVRVTVFARQAADAPSASFALAYSTSEVGNSGWQKFTLTDQLSGYSFTYAVPAMVKGLGDYVGILPDLAGAQGAVEIAGIVTEVALPGTEFPPPPDLAMAPPPPQN